MTTKFMRILAIAGALALAGGATAAVASVGGSLVSSPAQVDVKGPCDEAEHANDPQCAGEHVPEDDAGDQVEGESREDDNSGPGENSGPGNAKDQGDQEDNSGPGSGDDSDSEDDSDDHSGQDGDQGKHEDNSGQDSDQGESGSDDDD